MKSLQETVQQESPRVTLRSFDRVYHVHKKSHVGKWVLGLSLFLVVLLFLPWTQNIRARGTVTTLDQEGRPQQLNAIIGGRIVKWYVREGQRVKAGDTLAQLAEIKDAYLDPQLLERTESQIRSKEASVEAYGSKINATNSQIEALDAGRDLKVQQLDNKLRQTVRKLQSDSMELVAAINDARIAERQLERQRALRDSGLSSLQQVEQRVTAYQNALAKRTTAEIKLSNTRIDLVNITVEKSSATQEYAEKVFKAQGDRAAALSDQATGQGEVTKLESQYANYRIRSGQYFLTAPQNGQVIGITKQGLNEIIKEGEVLLSVVPDKGRQAVELFVRPQDLPLVAAGQPVRFLFDGYPAVVFSGWPEASYGIFDGRVVAVETAVGANGLFRILVEEDRKRKPWPPTLTLGSGAQGIMLLKNVPIWYELWRNINGFPPEYYQPAAATSDKTKADAAKK
jgi:multidrug resistance efflux pump